MSIFGKPILTGVGKGSASGAVASFSDGAKDLPLRSLIADIDPVQEGTGDPSPDNVRPISGWSAVKVLMMGKNLLPMTVAEIKAINISGTWSGDAYTNAGVTFTVNTNGGGNIVSISTSGTATGLSVLRLNNNIALPEGTYILSGCPVNSIDASIQGLNGAPYDMGSGATFTTITGNGIRIRIPNGGNANGLTFYPMIRLASISDATYHPYSGNQYTIQLGDTYYGGTLDVTTGVLTVDRANIPSYNGESLPGEWISDRDVYAPGTTPTIGAQVVYTLATPITISLTATEISTLQGANNIWADSGDVNVEYLKQSLMRIESAIRPPHYGCVWDQENAQMRRTGLARAITTNTQNFKHSGSVNPNYDNPFDSIYPWSGRKLCNISLALYQALQPGDNIKDCVTYWETDDGFSYNDPDGVWVYTPEFWGTSYWIGSQRYFEVSPVELAGYHHYEEQITARWRGVSETRTIDGTDKTILLPKPGVPIVNTALSTIHTYAKNGGMTLDSVYTLDASLLLYLVEYANYNAQSAIGNGVSDLYDQTTLHPDAAVTSGTTVQFTGLTYTQLADFIVGAIVDFGMTSGGAQTAKTYITAVETTSGITTVTLADAVTITTDTFVSIHGRINYADADIGSMSGYIGTHGKADAYYRGEALWGNMFLYTLGAYKSDTEHVWLAEEGTEDNYDAINTSVHTDTEIVLSSTANYIKKLAWPDSLGILFACALCTEVGGSSSNPVGDYFYTTTGSSRVLVVGGHAYSGTNDGPFYWRWGNTASYSNWNSAGRPRLKSP